MTSATFAPFAAHVHSATSPLRDAVFCIITCCRRYVASAAGISQSDPNYDHWKGVFEHFLPKEEEQPLDTDAVDRMLASASNAPLPPSAPEEKSLSKRRKKLMSRLRYVYFFIFEF